METWPRYPVKVAVEQPVHQKRRRARRARPMRWRRPALAATMPIAAAMCACLAVLLGLRALGLAQDADAAGALGWARPEVPVEIALLGVGALVACWLAAHLTLAAACAAAAGLGHRWRTGELWVARHAPGLVRRALVTTVGASLGMSAIVGTAHAASPPQGEDSIDLGWVATSTWRPSGAASSDAEAESSPNPSSTTAATLVRHEKGASRAATSRDAAKRQAVTVRSGDTLWGIAADHLAQGATDAEIAAEWPRWYTANRALIGEDPDVIVEGARLAAPQGDDS